MPPITKPGPGLPKAGAHFRNGHSLTIAADGAIKVSAGDTISKYALILFGNSMIGWEEFGRMHGGVLRPLANPNQIITGETLYHIPTRSKTKAGAGTAVNSSLGKFGKHKDAMRKRLLEGVPAAQQKLVEEEFFKFLEDTKTDWSNALFIADRVEDAIKIVNYYKAMKALKLPLSDIKGIVPIITKVKEGDKFIQAVIKPGGSLGKVLETVGKAGQGLGFVMLAMQVYVHIGREDYYAAAAEVYSTGLGLAIPWAGLIDGVAGFVTALNGSPKDPKKDQRFWKYLKVLNIIGLGAAGIDAIGTMIHVLVAKDYDSQRMDRLIERLRSSPAQIFLEMGENLDKALRYFETMPKEEFDQVMTASNFYNWIKYELTGKLP